MSIAKILEDRKTDNMAEVERHGGVWKDGAFLFPDGSGDSFRHNMRVIATAREFYAFTPSSGE